MLQSATTISQSIPDYTAQLNTMSLLRGKSYMEDLIFGNDASF